MNWLTTYGFSDKQGREENEQFPFFYSSGFESRTIEEWKKYGNLFPPKAVKREVSKG